MIKTSGLIKHFLLVSLLIDIYLFNGCAQKTEENIVAKVADRTITADEFAFAYEMAPRSITSLTSKQARQTVLDQLIDRIVLARQAERLRLDDDTLLQRTVDFYKRLAVNRELYLKHIRRLVEVSEQEERQAFEYSKTKLYVRHFSTKQFDLARQVSLGIVQFEHTPIFTGAPQVELTDYGIVDKISWRDIPQEVANILYNLPLRQYSDPFFDGQRYHVFQVVEFEKEVLLRESDFQANRQSLNGIIRQRKEQKLSAGYVQKIMTRQNVIIKAEALNRLTEEVWRNRPTEVVTLEQFITNREINTIGESSRDFLNKPIATFKSGEMTVADILINYKVNPVKISYKSKMTVRESLKNAVGMYVRDWVLSEQGMKERLDRKPSVIAEERSRSEYLLMRKMLAYLGREFYAQNQDTTGRQEQLEKYIANYEDNLRRAENIEIYSSNLMAVKTTDEGLARKIDFVVFHTQ